MKKLLIFLMTLIFLVGCGGGEPPTAVPQATVPQPLDTAVPTPTLPAPTDAVEPTEATAQVEAPATAVPEPTAEPANGAPPGQEAILITEPGPGWRLTSPIHVSGMADPTFEQNLVVRLSLEDGTELSVTPVTISADVGQRGPFEVDIPFSVSGEQRAFLQVYATSARDGGITHLSSVSITIADSGEESRPEFEPMDEWIVISDPVLNASVSGGVIYIEGVAMASFEQTLQVEVLDETGAVIGAQPVIVEAPDLGQPGPFVLALPYTEGATGAGRVVVRDISPASGEDVHVASVEIRLE
ncbi:MAG: Gmad2 immunoglobulin-like domain-containing protein [Candidatus Promineifilaceae bacterium]